MGAKSGEKEEKRENEADPGIVIKCPPPPQQIEF